MLFGDVSTMMIGIFRGFSAWQVEGSVILSRWIAVLAQWWLVSFIGVSACREECSVTVSRWCVAVM